MIVLRESYIILILASFCQFCTCETVEVPFLTQGGRRPKPSLSSVDLVPNYTTKQDNIADSSDFLVNTPGCYIPDYNKYFKYAYTLYRGYSSIKDPCGMKAVYLYNIGDNKVVFGVNDTVMKFYSNDTKYSCCYKYAYKTASFPGQGIFTKLHYTKCTPFRNGTTTTLRYEIIRVTCITRNHDEIYNDSFISVRKLRGNRTPLKMGENNTVWNVLLLGIHSMSRARFLGTMPETYKYLLNHNWLDYKGYTKVDSETFPNLMAILTGMNSSRVYNKCDSGLYKCEADIIWNNFNASGYRTAYGEDFLELPDTLSTYKGFIRKPTDHYMRPFFLIGEKVVSDILCTDKRPSAAHLLGYAYNFANSYKYNQFFGIFWINSYTNGAMDNPSKLDNEIVNWLQKLQKENILRRTFVILFSDYGIKYGAMKVPVQSYYDDRLPMLFIWVPHTFQKKFRQMYNNMFLNQHRLTTPYDLYVTLGDIIKLADRSSNGTVSEACPECSGLFNLKSLFRTCTDARINQHWCVCHTMIEVRIDAVETINTLRLAMEHLNKLVQQIKTITCYECRPLKLLSVLRSHAFQSGTKTFHVVAFQTSNEVKYEATVSYRRNTGKVTLLRSLTDYSKKGICVRDLADRPFCHCLMRCKTLFV